MKRNVKITLIACLVWVFFVLYVTYSRYASNNEVTALDAEELREIGAMIYESPVILEPFELIDHHGQAFTDKNLLGQWSLIFFGFTNCPDICPLTMQELTSFYRSLEGSPLQSDTQVLMISVDPFRDDTPTVARYMSAFDSSFLGITGEFSTVSKLANNLFVATGIMPVPAPDGGVPRNFLIDHSGNILIVDSSGQYRGFMEPNIKRNNIKEAYELIRQAL